MMWPRTRFLLLAIAILGLSGLLAVSGCPSSEQTGKASKEGKKSPILSPEAMDHFRQGRKFLDEKKTDEALKEFQETVRLSPDSALARFWLGKVHFYRKEMDQAEKLFKKVLKMDPQNYHAMAMLGRLYSLDRTKLDQAEKYLKQALDYSPENLGAHFDLARIYARKGERGKAIRKFNYLFIKEREFYIYHFELGRILEAWGQKEQALREYRRAHFINPKSEPAAQAIKRLESEKTSPAPKSESSETTKTKEKPAPGK